MENKNNGFVEENGTTNGMPNSLNGHSTNLKISTVSSNYAHELKDEHASLKNRKDDDMLKILKMGCDVLKYKKNGKKYRRRIYLDPDELTIRYSGGKKFWKPNKIVEIPDIREIRLGSSTKTFRNISTIPDRLKENLAFSLIFGQKHDTLDVCAKSPEIKDQWVKALKHVISYYKNMEQEKAHEKWAIEHFNRADINKDGGLSFEETLQLLNHMNINMDKRYAKKLFDASDINTKKNKTGEDVLDQKEFLCFYKLLIRRPEINDIIRKYSKNGSSFLEPEELKNFMVTEQKQTDVTLDDCKKLIETYDKTNQEGTMSAEGMRCMLVSRDFALFNKAHLEVYQDMSKPLTHYFINSSHNTYLSQDQLVGPCSVENYIRALRDGCRCVEIDVWDGADGDPVVFHGHTLTPKIKFDDIIQAISTYAFETSEYPVIISLENHCSIPQQKLMAHYLHTYLEDKIYTNSRNTSSLPSPEELKNRFLIKGKKLPNTDQNIGMVSEEDEAAEIQDVIVQENLESNNEPPNKTIKLAKELSDITYLQSVHFGGVGEKRPATTMCSFVESDAIAMIAEDIDAFSQYNQKYLSRIYPNGIRTDSSNFSAIDFWKAGCQIVAMNFQHSDKKMQMYHAQFRDNGRCGYVLKPQNLLSNTPSDGTTTPTKKILKLQIISAQQLPKPNRNRTDKDVVDPYVKIDVMGFKTTQKCKTRIIENNGFNPVWNESFEFIIDDPESTIVRFVVKDFDTSSQNDFIGQYSIPFNCITQGYRTCKLKDEHDGWLTLGSTLLLHVNISDYVSDVRKIF